MKATDAPWPHTKGEKEVFKCAPTTLYKLFIILS